MWFLGQAFLGLLRSGDQLTVVCAQETFHHKQESGWRALRIEGIFNFAETGVLESLLCPLAYACIRCLCAVDLRNRLCLVKGGAQLDTTAKALEESGYQIIG